MDDTLAKLAHLVTLSHRKPSKSLFLKNLSKYGTALEAIQDKQSLEHSEAVEAVAEYIVNRSSHCLNTYIRPEIVKIAKDFINDARVDDIVVRISSGVSRITPDEIKKLYEVANTEGKRYNIEGTIVNRKLMTLGKFYDAINALEQTVGTFKTHHDFLNYFDLAKSSVIPMLKLLQDLEPSADIVLEKIICDLDY